MGKLVMMETRGESTTVSLLWHKSFQEKARKSHSAWWGTRDDWILSPFWHGGSFGL